MPHRRLTDVVAYMKWFRFYSEVAHDPKVQLLDPRLFKSWVTLLCMANENEPRGTLPDFTSMAYTLRLSPAKTADVVTELKRANLVNNDGENLWMHGFRERQHDSDDTTQRTRKHRSMKREGNVPVTPPDTEVETDTDPEEETEERRGDIRDQTPPHHAVVKKLWENRIGVLPFSLMDEFNDYLRFTPEDWFTKAIEVTALEADKPCWAFCKKVIDGAVARNQPPGPRLTEQMPTTVAGFMERRRR